MRAVPPAPLKKNLSRRKIWVGGHSMLAISVTGPGPFLWAGKFVCVAGQFLILGCWFWIHVLRFEGGLHRTGCHNLGSAGSGEVLAILLWGSHSGLHFSQASRVSGICSKCVLCDGIRMWSSNTPEAQKAPSIGFRV